MRWHFRSFRSRVIGRSWLSRSSDPRFFRQNRSTNVRTRTHGAHKTHAHAHCTYMRMRSVVQVYYAIYLYIISTCSLIRRAACLLDEQNAAFPCPKRMVFGPLGPSPWAPSLTWYETQNRVKYPKNLKMTKLSYIWPFLELLIVHRTEG